MREVEEMEIGKIYLVYGRRWIPSEPARYIKIMMPRKKKEISGKIYFFGDVYWTIVSGYSGNPMCKGRYLDEYEYERMGGMITEFFSALHFFELTEDEITKHVVMETI